MWQSYISYSFCSRKIIFFYYFTFKSTSQTEEEEVAPPPKVPRSSSSESVSSDGNQSMVYSIQCYRSQRRRKNEPTDIKKIVREEEVKSPERGRGSVQTEAYPMYDTPRAQPQICPKQKIKVKHFTLEFGIFMWEGGMRENTEVFRFCLWQSYRFEIICCMPVWPPFLAYLRMILIMLEKPHSAANYHNFGCRYRCLFW